MTDTQPIVWEAEEADDGAYMLFVGANAQADAHAFQTAAAARGVVVAIGPVTAPVNPTVDEAVDLLWSLS